MGNQHKMNTIEEVKRKLESVAFGIDGVLSVGIIEESGKQVIEITTIMSLPHEMLQRLQALVTEYQSQASIVIRESNEYKPL